MYLNLDVVAKEYSQKLLKTKTGKIFVLTHKLRRQMSFLMVLVLILFHYLTLA